jgi:hypothetical protein
MILSSHDKIIAYDYRKYEAASTFPAKHVMFQFFFDDGNAHPLD